MNFIFSFVVLSLQVLLVPAAVTIRFATDTVACEGEVLHVGVVCTGTVTGPVTAMVAVTGGSATAGEDYQLPATLMVSWSVEDMANGHSAKYLDFPTNTDALTEGEERIELSITPISGGASVLNSGAIVKILETQDYPNGLIAMKDVFYAVTEDAGMMTVTLERHCNTAGSATLPMDEDTEFCMAPVCPTAGVNFVTPPHITFAAGDQYQEAVYLIMNDNVASDDLFLQIAPGPLQSGAGATYERRQAWIYIEDTTVTVEQDPHVVLRVSGIDLPVCFDLVGEEGHVVILIKGSGYKVLGTFIGDGYFGAIDILTTGKKIKITTEAFSVGRMVKAWNETDTAIAPNVDFLDNNKLRVSVDDCVMTVERVQDGNAGAYLNFFVDELKHDKAGGIIGSILTTDYKLKERDGMATLTSINGVAVAKKEAKFGHECWFVDEEGKNLYPNMRADYDI